LQIYARFISDLLKYISSLKIAHTLYLQNFEIPNRSFSNINNIYLYYINILNLIGPIQVYLKCNLVSFNIFIPIFQTLH